MKILFVVDNLEIGGGITTALYSIIRECYNHNFEVDLLTLSNEDKILEEYKKYCTKINVNCYYLKLINLSKDDLKRCRTFHCRIAILVIGVSKRILTRIRLWIKFISLITPKFDDYDIAVAYRQGAVFAQIIDSINANVKIGFIHGDVKILKGVDKWIKNYKKIDKIACVSHSVRTGFEDKFPEYKDKTGTVYNMFDPKLIKSKANTNNTFLHRDSKELIFVTLSRLTVEKGANRIPEICKEIVDRCGYNNFRWYVLGDGELYDSLVKETVEKELDNILFFEGVKKNPFTYLIQSDAMVLLSFSEGYPMSVIESLILGIPVITTSYGAVHEMIKDGEDGLVINQNTVKGISDCLCTYLLDNNLRTRIKKGAKKYVYDSGLPWHQFMNIIDYDGNKK